MDHQLHASLSRLVGTWRTTGHVISGPGAGASWSGYDIYEWLPGEQHLVHRVDVTIAGERSESLEVFTARPDDPSTFEQISFGQDGSVERATGSFDDQGRYRNELPASRAILTFDAPDRLHATWERREDDGTWQTWMDVHFELIGPPHIEVRTKDDHTA